jgi:DNA-binding FadR family transcriptional regulator
MVAAPRKFVIPPAQAKQTKAFNTFVEKWSPKYPGLKQWAPQIVQYAAENKIDPVYLASVLMTESRVNANTGDSSAGAVGIGQLLPSTFVGQYVPWDKTRTQRVTAQDLRNPVFNLRLAASYLAQQVGNYGYQGAYSQGYNPGFKATAGQPDPIARVPHGYLPGVSSPGTAGGAGAGTPTGPAATTTTADKWVVVTQKGGLKIVAAATPPKNAVKDASGQAYSLSNWQQVQTSLDSVYLAYAGTRATPKQVASFIKAPVSTYQLQQQLSNPNLNPRFTKSPIWLTHAPEYEAVYKSIFGNNADAATPEARQAIAYGVVHNLSETAFQQHLRDSAGYNASEEYKANAATFRSGYESIYGAPDAQGEQRIDQAVRQGMNGDQWQQYLRAQPEYTASGEFQRNVYNLFGSMALLPGGETALQTSPATAAAVPAVTGG